MMTCRIKTVAYKQAHTLIELLVVMAMLILMASGISVGFRTVLAYDRSDEARASAQEEAVRAAEWISRNIATATAIDCSTNTPRISVFLPPNTTIGTRDDVAFLQYQITNDALRQTTVSAGQTNYAYLIQPFRNPQYNYAPQDLTLEVDPDHTNLWQLTIEMEVNLARQPAESSRESITNSQWILLHNITL